MTNEDSGYGPFGPMSRRSAIGSLLTGAAFAAPGALAAETAHQASQTAPPRMRSDMKTSINLPGALRPTPLSARRHAVAAVVLPS